LQLHTKNKINNKARDRKKSKRAEKMPLSADKPLNKAPNGTDDYDQGALNDSQQQKLNQKKVYSKLNIFKMNT